jgi:hypothetical protein
MSSTTSRLPVAVAAIAATTVIAACGSNSATSPGSSSPGRHLTPAQAQQDAVNFSRCMRSHGVPNFPDPTSPREFKDSFSSSAAQSPAFKSAETACRHLLPAGGPPSQSAVRSQAQLTALLAFARCLRSRGFPDFPDPTSSGQITHEMLASSGIDLRQPAVLHAADGCVSVAHGVITKAAVARFVAGQ